MDEVFVIELTDKKWLHTDIGKIIAVLPLNTFSLGNLESLKATPKDRLIKVKSASLLELPKEGFRITISNQTVTLISSSLSGIFYGLQEIASNPRNLVSTTFIPIQKERALMLDIGRKFYDKQWICNTIDLLASLKMNTLQLHFSENEGFRIESSSFPKIVSTEYLTKKEVKELISYAKARFINIIPALDTPGHLQQLLRYYPQWRLESLQKTGHEKNCRALDITNKDAVTGIKQLLLEYFELFSECYYFHLGADEFVDFDELEYFPKLQETARQKYGPTATGIELYIEYTNELIAFTHLHGFQARVWNDGFYRLNQPNHVELSKEVEITYWTKWHKHMAPVTTFIERGYRLINYNDNFLYFVLGEAAGYTYPTAQKISTSWRPVNFAQHQELNQEQMASVIGATFSIWSDLPDALSQTEVYQKITGPVTSFATQLWKTSQYQQKII